MFRTSLNALQFSLRRNLLGRLKLRPGLPAVFSSPGEESFYRQVLETALPDGGAFADTVIDVGCRNWSYAGALAAFFPRGDLTGIELDASRRYWNLHRRADQAEAFAQLLRREGRGVRAREGDFRELRPSDTLPLSLGRAVVITFFYPFVSANPCLGWGLPERYADFLPLLEHAKALLAISADASRIVSCHQGEWEAEIAEAAYRKAGLRVSRSVLEVAEFQDRWPSAHDAHVFSV